MGIADMASMNLSTACKDFDSTHGLTNPTTATNMSNFHVFKQRRGVWNTGWRRKKNNYHWATQAGSCSKTLPIESRLYIAGYLLDFAIQTFSHR